VTRYDQNQDGPDRDRYCQRRQGIDLARYVPGRRRVKRPSGVFCVVNESHARLHIDHHKITGPAGTRFRTATGVLRQVCGNRGLLGMRMLAGMQRAFGQQRQDATVQVWKAAGGHTQQGGDPEIGRGLPGCRDQMTKHASSRGGDARISLHSNG